MAKKRIQKPTKSYIKFESVVHRSLNLLTLQEKIEDLLSLPKITTKVDLSDLSRAAVVLSIAAMDAYFTDVFAELFIPYLKKNKLGIKTIDILNSAGFNTNIALELLTMKRPYRRIRSLLENHLEKHTTQKTQIIDELFMAYGIKDFSKNIQKYKGRKNLIRSIELLVERRHQIAHEGDLNDHRKLNEIESNKIKRRISDVVQSVSGADEILQKSII